MSERKTKSKIGKFFSSAGGFVSVVVGLLTILAFFEVPWSSLRDGTLVIIEKTIIDLEIREVPKVIWQGLLILFVVAMYGISYILKRINLIAGSFEDDFKRGLKNWEYGGEDWKTQRGEEGHELSITNSSTGGISNFGLWDNYEFSFECKIINRNVGWIIRATDRENYVMMQLSNTKEYVSLNPHYRIRGKWLVQEKRLNASPRLVARIKSQQWLKVRIVVFGNTIDIILDGERVLNYHIPDPLRIPKDELVAPDGKENSASSAEELFEAFSFPAGRVGFRCFGSEHALIRNVRVRPRNWKSANI